MSQFAKANQGVWDQMAEKHDLKKGIFEKYSWGFIDGICIAFDFDREYDMGAIRSAGFTEAVDTVKDGFCLAFERMRKAKIIP